MPKIVFDTSTGTTNLGDHIIMDAVNQIADELFKDDFVINIATHLNIHPLDLIHLRKYDLAFVGGTNLLKNANFLDGQWKIGLKELPFFRRKIVLFGVGWWQYQAANPSLYTQILYKQLFSTKYLHAVRDQYTLQKLAQIGIKNVVNTGCPTVWELDEQHCAGINTDKKKIVVTTVTDYLRDPMRDRQMLETLKNEYQEVHIWLQGKKDKLYVQSLTDGLHFIAPKLSEFDRFLDENVCDYIGTRLHAGIRALQKKRNALIIGIDNRAKEMHKDIGLPVLSRGDMNELKKHIEDVSPVQLTLNKAQIAQWKAQFQ